MSKKNIVFTIALAQSLIALGAAAADSPLETARRLENTADSATTASSRLLRVIESEPQAFPPDPCRDEQSATCRSVRALGAIGGEAESLLAGVEVLDTGDDRRALRRRLSRVTDTVAFAEARLGGVTGDWLDSELPPDPCTPAVQSQVDVLGTSAEAAARLAGELDTCGEPDSVARRLGHVSESLLAANSRLEALALNPPDPDDVTDAELAAIIDDAERIAALAESLRGEGSTP